MNPATAIRNTIRVMCHGFMSGPRKIGLDLAMQTVAEFFDHAIPCDGDYFDRPDTENIGDTDATCSSYFVVDTTRMLTDEDRQYVARLTRREPAAALR